MSLRQNLTHPAFHGALVKQPVALPDPVSTLMPEVQKRHYGLFWVALIGGFLGLVALTVATVDTHSQNLEKLFIVIGSLFVPVIYIFYMDQRSLFVSPRWKTIFWTFLLGVFLSIPMAVLLESFLPSGTGSPGPAFLTGLIEEFCKATAVFWLLRRKHRDLQFEMDGIILGAAAGMGFAALEDMLYGATAFKHGVDQVLVIVWLRQVLGPFGHGTWTAIITGTIWRVKGAGPPRITWAVIGAYLLASTLHGLWDWLPFEGLLGLAWFLAVGVAGILILRAMIHQALDQEKLYLAKEEGAQQPGTV